MRIAIAINAKHPNYNNFLAFLSQASVSISSMIVDIVSFSDVSEIYSLVNKKCSYIVILNRYCYIDLNKLRNWLLDNKPNIAGLSNANGVGDPYLMILKTHLAKPVENLEDLSDDYVENYFLNWIEHFIQSYGEYTETTRNDTLKYRILSLDSVCYLSHCGHTDGLFHKSIFVCLGDMDTNFIDILQMLLSGIKEVFYKDKVYKLKIGKSFFIYKYWHFAVLPDKKILLWNNIKNDWTPANKKESKILQQLNK